MPGRKIRTYPTCLQEVVPDRRIHAWLALFTSAGTRVCVRVWLVYKRYDLMDPPTSSAGGAVGGAVGEGAPPGKPAPAPSKPQAGGGQRKGLPPPGSGPGAESWRWGRELTGSSRRGRELPVALHPSIDIQDGM